MASSIPAALDYLVSLARDLPQRKAVNDGWPAERGDTKVIIGIDDDSGDAPVEGSYSQLERREVESVEVRCMVEVRRAGTGAASRARSDAFAIFDGFRQAIRDDRRLGGAVTPGLPARIERFTMAQTDEPRQAGEGRVCAVKFTVAWSHRA
jgi:hypothetical protein